MDLIPFNPWEPIHATQGNLPHWQQCRRTYFITWRTADSIPVAWLRKLHHERDHWLRSHRVSLEKIGEMPPEMQHEFHREFTHAWHDQLDLGHGECLLKRPALREPVALALHHFDNQRYALGDYVVMPNHVHLLVTPDEGQDIERLCFSWKRFSSGEINRLLARRGEFWQVESYDHVVRSGDALHAIQRYIAENPTKAGLRMGEYSVYQPEAWR